jgi:hypothetical protein
MSVIVKAVSPAFSLYRSTYSLEGALKEGSSTGKNPRLRQLLSIAVKRKNGSAGKSGKEWKEKGGDAAHSPQVHRA